jgi:hypothetical protein
MDVTPLLQSASFASLQLQSKLDRKLRDGENRKGRSSAFQLYVSTAILPFELLRCRAAAALFMSEMPSSVIFRVIVVCGSIESSMMSRLMCVD